MKNIIDNKSSSLVNRLIDGIRSGFYPVGSQLPSERKLGECYGGSRTIAREAARILLDKGVLERCGRHIMVAKYALKQIEVVPHQEALKVALVMPIFQIGNPIIQQIITVIAAQTGAEFSLTCFPVERYVHETLTNLRQFDLVLSIGSLGDDFVLEAVRKQCEMMILLNAANPNFNYITPDHYAGGRLMAQCLYEHHHRNIGAIYLSGDQNTEFGQRFNGARDFLSEHNLLIKTVPADLGIQASRSSIYQQAFEYLYRIDPGITSVMGFWDGIVMGLYELLNAKGLRIPDDISMIGFDDQFFCSMLNPPLTTVRYPAEALGNATVDAIRQFAQNRNLVVRKKIMPVLLERQSVRTLL